MGLFKRMKDPVRGTAEVVAQMAPMMGTKGDLRLVVTAEGMEPTAVEVSVSALNTTAIERWPMERDRLPVTVDRAKPQNVRIEWDELPTAEERFHQADDQAVQARLAQLRGEGASE